jgi:CheY-like chemotaxis protein/nitrogen-specific signal transduction histidine kinase
MPLRNKGGEIVGTFGITRDITDLKQTSEALKRAKEAAEEANRTKSQFLANMSHELRTPLNSIIGFSNIMLKNKAGNLTASELSFLGRILSNGKHLLDLINQILDLSKIEARKVELQVSSVRVDELVRETVAQQEGLVRERPVVLRCDVPERVAPIQTDPDKLRQILINLIGNSLKFTEKGSVTLRVVTDVRDHHPVRIDVVDTGIGIPGEQLAGIFNAFQQAEATTARRFGGTGLGLTISQALCELMGHRIEVTSEVGRGSTFSILLGSRSEQPAGTVSAGPATPRADSGGTTLFLVANLRGKRVLVIDDEADARLLLRHTLQEFGCDVSEAASGEEGLRAARQLRPDLITVDLMMPRMTGSEVVGAVKSDPDLKHIPVVVVSIVSGEHRGHILGAVELLQKPIVREELLATLLRCLPQCQSRILVVDDEEGSRELMRSLLELEGFQVRTVASAQEGREALDQSPCDLILLDLMMPGMDGFTFLRTLRSDLRYRNLPVVVVTAKDLTREEADELRRNASDVVQKSAAFNQDLKDVLRRLCQPVIVRPPAPSGPAAPNPDPST